MKFCKVLQESPKERHCGKYKLSIMLLWIYIVFLLQTAGSNREDSGDDDLPRWRVYDIQRAMSVTFPTSEKSKCQTTGFEW